MAIIFTGCQIKMPQLSTGRKVAVYLSLLGEMLGNPYAHLEDLGKIRKLKHLYERLKIMKFVDEKSSESKAPDMNADSRNLHELEGMRSITMDYSVQDVIDGKADWSKQEIIELKQWLVIGGAEKKCREALKSIQDIKLKLEDTVDALSYSDIDPDQDEEERFRRASIVVDVLTKGHSD